MCPDVLLFRLWSPARERRIYRTQTQASAYVMRLLRYKASPSRCDDRRTSRSLSGATRHTLFGRLDLARVRGHVELAWAEAGDDVTVYPPFAVACGWPYSGQIAREQSLCRRCVTVYCAGVEYKGAKGRGKIGRARLPRTRASLLTGRTCDW